MKRIGWNLLCGSAAITLALVLAAAMTAVLGGCASNAQRQATIADAELLAKYVTVAQPAVEKYAATQPDGAQLVADTRIMAGQLRANAELRLDALRVDDQAVRFARQALETIGVIITTYQSMEARNAGNQTTQPTAAD